MNIIISKGVNELHYKKFPYQGNVRTTNNQSLARLALEEEDIIRIDAIFSAAGDFGISGSSTSGDDNIFSSNSFSLIRIRSKKLKFFIQKNSFKSSLLQ